MCTIQIRKDDRTYAQKERNTMRNQQPNMRIRFHMGKNTSKIQSDIKNGNYHTASPLPLKQNPKLAFRKNCCDNDLFSSKLKHACLSQCNAVWTSLVTTLLVAKANSVSTFDGVFEFTSQENVIEVLQLHVNAYHGC